ncbi:MAG TPA: cupin domain-containing protein [Cyclobacteriaceae bacterium]
MISAEHWINKLHLQPHPEGGFYKEIYRSEESVSTGLPSRFSGPRNFLTSIYFLLRSEDISTFHRIKSDELWYYHKGGSLSIYIIEGDRLTVRCLGDDPERGEELLVMVPANSWFGAKVDEEETFTLCSCAVAPGFDFADFELAERNTLLKTFPQHQNIIELLTRE